MTSSAIRLQAVHRELQSHLDKAIASHDSLGYYRLSHAFREAVADFGRELKEFTGQDEIARRAGICKTLTCGASRYQEVMRSIFDAGMDECLPFLACKALRQGREPCLPTIEFVREELRTVRRMLGPTCQEPAIAPEHRQLFRQWERELVLVQDEAETLHPTGCAWLEFVRNCCLTDTAADDFEVEYNEAGEVVSIVSRDGVPTFDKDTMLSMKAAAKSIVSTAKSPKSAASLDGVKGDLVDAIRELGLGQKRTRDCILKHLDSKGTETSDGYAKQCLAELVRLEVLVKDAMGYALPEWRSQEG